MDLWLLVGWPNFSFYHIEREQKNVISEIKNGPLEKTTPFIGAISFGGCSYGGILCCSSILK